MALKKNTKDSDPGAGIGAVRSAKRRLPRGPGNPEKIVPYQFKKWQSGNPKGRPQNTLLSKAYRALLESACPDDPEGRSDAELIARRLVKQAVANEKYCVSAAAELADRTEGRPRQAVDLTGKLETPASSDGLTNFTECILGQRRPSILRFRGGVSGKQAVHIGDVD